MAKTPEGKVKDQIKLLFLKYGAYYTMPVKMGYGNNGELDFNAGLNGFRLDVEAKAGSNTPSELQWVHVERLAAAGCPSMVIKEDNLHVLQKWLELASMDGMPAAKLRVRPIRKPKGRGVLKHHRF